MFTAAVVRAMVFGATCAFAAACATHPQPTPPSPEAGTSASDAPALAPAASTGNAVRGTMRMPEGARLLTATLVMSPLPGQDLEAVPSEDVSILPDGSFEFRDVAPGRYQIRARAQTAPDGPALFASYRAIVRADATPFVEIVLAPGATAQGRVRADAGQPLPALQGVRVTAPMADGTTFGDAAADVAARDGSFVLHGLAPGRHVIQLEGLPDPWVVKQVIYRGQDVAAAGVDVESGQHLRDVAVIVTRPAASR